jgi:hypothetical protein
MAGQHQIWQHTVADGSTKVFSGDGYERNLNGKRYNAISLFFSNPVLCTLMYDRT